MHPRTLEILGYLDSQRTALRGAINAIPPALRDTAPAPGRWSAAAVVEHLALVEDRIARLLTERIAEARKEGLGAEPSADPVLPTIDVGRVLDRAERVSAPENVQPRGMGTDEAWAALVRADAALRSTAIEGDGLALGSVALPHSVLGSMTIYQWFAFVGAHEARHAAQIREIEEGLK